MFVERSAIRGGGDGRGRGPVHVTLALVGAVSGAQVEVAVVGLLAVHSRVQLRRVRQGPVLVRLEEGASSAGQRYGPGLDVLVHVLGLVATVPVVIRCWLNAVDPDKIVAAEGGATVVVAVAAAARSRMIYGERVIPAVVAALQFR